MNEILTFEVNGIPFDMVRVDGGSFMMSSYAGNYGWPVHRETVQTFYLGRTEVTQELWKAVMGVNPSYFKGSDLPVESVSWDDCQRFIERLNQRIGENFRLPSEAEWEYAARGGNRSQGYKYSGSNDFEQVGWSNDNSGAQTHPVGRKLANEIGLFDMSGNVFEWCQDYWYDNENAPNSCHYRVCRGGSWSVMRKDSRVDCHSFNSHDMKCSSIGLRLAL